MGWLKNIGNALFGGQENRPNDPPVGLARSTSQIGGYTGTSYTDPVTGEIKFTTELSPDEAELQRIISAGEISTATSLYGSEAADQALADDFYNQYITAAKPSFDAALAASRALAEARAVQSGTAGSDISDRQFAGVEAEYLKNLSQLYLQGRITAQEFMAQRQSQRIAKIQTAENIKGLQFTRAQTALQPSITARANQQTLLQGQHDDAAARADAQEAAKVARTRNIMNMIATGVAMGVPAGGGLGDFSFSNLGTNFLANLQKGAGMGGTATGGTDEATAQARTNARTGRLSIPGINGGLPNYDFNIDTGNLGPPLFRRDLTPGAPTAAADFMPTYEDAYALTPKGIVKRQRTSKIKESAFNS